MTKNNLNLGSTAFIALTSAYFAIACEIKVFFLLLFVGLFHNKVTYRYRLHCRYQYRKNASKNRLTRFLCCFRVLPFR